MTFKTSTRQSLNRNEQFNSYLNFSSLQSLVNEIMHFISALLRKYTSISLQEITIFQWIILFVCVWVALHMVLFKLTKTFLRRVGVDDTKSKLLSHAVWDLCFFFMSSYMIIENLNLNVLKFSNDSVKIIHNKGSDCFLMDKEKIVRSEVLFVIVTAYFIHSTSWTLLTLGFRTIEFLQKELITVFFILTRALRCTEYGLLVLLYLHSYYVFEEVTKLMCSLGLICNSKILRNLTKCCYIVQLLYWSRQYLYLSPQLIMSMFSRKLDTTMVRTELNLILLLPVTLTLYYVLAFYMSPANRLLCHYIRPAGNSSVTIEYLVFGQFEENTNSAGVKRDVSIKKKKSKGEEERKNQQKVALYQTVKCYMVLRRKLKRIREEKMNKLTAKVSNGPPLTTYNGCTDKTSC